MKDVLRDALIFEAIGLLSAVLIALILYLPFPLRIILFFIVICGTISLHYYLLNTALEKEAWEKSLFFLSIVLFTSFVLMIIFVLLGINPLIGFFPLLFIGVPLLPLIRKRSKKPKRRRKKR